MKQELENKRPDSEERRSIWQRWKQNLKDWVWYCKEHPDWLDLDVQTWVSTHIGQPLRRRWHRLRELRHQNRQRQLPETEWKLGQLLLFLWGSLPRMGSDLRERLTRRRKGAIRSGGRMRAFFEGMKLHPAVFVAGAVAVTAVAVCLSMYTIGATARYDGVELGTVRSARSVSAAVDQLEEITRQTLSDTDYSIDSAKLEVRTGIVPRKELESTDALEENLTQQLGLVDYAYVLYVEGEPVAATTFPGAIEQLLEQLKKGYITDSTVDCYFVENVEVKQEYVDQSLIMNLGYIAEKLNATKAGEVTYTVKSGDVWSLIAEDNGMTNEELLALNPGYDISVLHTGDVLTISRAVPYLTVVNVERQSYLQDVACLAAGLLLPAILALYIERVNTAPTGIPNIRKNMLDKLRRTTPCRNCRSAEFTATLRAIITWWRAWRTIRKAACPVSSTASCTGMAACGSARWRCSLAG